MKKGVLFLFALLLCFRAFGQGSYELSLAKEDITLSNRKFYIASVLDNRLDKSNIGVFRLGLFDSSHPVLLKEGMVNSLQKFFDYALPKEGVQIPISIKVKTLKVAQWRTNNNEMGSVDLAIDYYFNNELLFSSKKNLTVTDEDIMQRHEGNIREALKLSLLEFNNCDWLTKMDSNAIASRSKVGVPVTVSAESTAGSIQFKPDVMQKEIEYGQNRNVFTLGYQIGGYSMVGFDYEIRFHDYIGIHAGAGYLGYTYGLMVHTAPNKNSSFINFSFKDGGFGLMQVAGVEYGGRLVMNRQTGLGLTFQIGVVRILKLDDAMKTALFDGETPKSMLSMGIGLSW